MSTLQDIIKRRQEEAAKRSAVAGPPNTRTTGAQAQSQANTPATQLGGQALKQMNTNLVTGAEEGFNLLDALEAFGTHAISSASFGLSEMAGLETEAWEDKSDWEKVAAGIGEFGGMLLPFKGMSTVIGKGLGAVTQLGTKQIARRTAAEASALALKRGVSKQGVKRFTIR